MSDLRDTDVPVLPRGVRTHWCSIREGWFLLAPERAVKLDAIGAAILERVDGARDLAAITGDLAATYQAPLEQITTDVNRFLGDLRGRRMLEVQS